MSKPAHGKAYPQEFREQVVEMAQYAEFAGRSMREVARTYGVSVDSVRRWLKQAGHDRGTPERRELARLRREYRRAQEDEALSRRIAAIHAESGETYGARRVHAALRAAGVTVSRQRVARLMQALGLRGSP